MKIFKFLFSRFREKSSFFRLKYHLKVQLRKIFFKVKSRPYLSSFLFLVLTLFLYLFFSLSSVSASRVELLALKKEMVKQPACHEDCRYERKKSREKLALSLAEDERLLADIEKYFSLIQADSPTENLLPDKEVMPEATPDFLEELIKIISQAYGANNPPSFLIDYLAHPAGDEKIKALIVREFLTEMTNPELVDYYFLILNSASSESLKEEAIKALSNKVNKPASFLTEHLDIILNLISSGVLSPSLNLDLIFLLSEYYQLYPIETKQTLISIYDNNTDPILRAAARDILLQFSELALDEIVVTAEDWEKYWR